MGREFRRFEFGFQSILLLGDGDTPLIARTTNGEQISPTPAHTPLNK